MKGSTHLAGALFAGALAGGAPVGLAVAGLAGLAPDWFQVNMPGGSALVKGATGHRGLSHWLIAAGLAWLVVRLIAPPWAVYVLAGWLSHIVLDLLAGGAPVLWPWSKRVTLAKIKTGSEMDTWVGASMLVLAAVTILWRVL